MANWNNVSVVPNTADYTTRVLVRAPVNPRKFNGTVIVEWANVTAGFDLDIMWALGTTDMFTRYGFAYVLVSAQAVGVAGLKNSDAPRYGSLEHPGDSYSYDIFSQVSKAVRKSKHNNMLNGLKVKKLIATGQSQSGLRLITYINAVQPLEKAFDGFLVAAHFAGGSDLSQSPLLSIASPNPLQFRTDLKAPVLGMEEESAVVGDLGSYNYFARQADSKKFRHCEITGTSHLTVLELSQAGLSILSGVPSGFLGCSQPFNIGDAYQHVTNAAFVGMHRWVKKGIKPSIAARLSVSTPLPSNPMAPILNVDQYGNAMGGIRTHVVDAPIALQSGSGNMVINPADFLRCALAGRTIPFDEPTLSLLYPNHWSYVVKVAKSTIRGVHKRFVLPEDGVDIIVDAIKSSIGR